MSETEGNTFWDIKGSALQTTTNQVINCVTIMTQHVTVMTRSDTHVIPIKLQMSCDDVNTM